MIILSLTSRIIGSVVATYLGRYSYTRSASRSKIIADRVSRRRFKIGNARERTWPRFLFNYLSRIYLIILKERSWAQDGATSASRAPFLLDCKLFINCSRIYETRVFLGRYIYIYTSPVDSRSFSSASSPSSGLTVVTTIRSRRIKFIVGARLRFQLSAHKLDLRNKMELSLQFLTLSLSRIACFFMWFRVRGVVLNWRKFSFLSIFFSFFFFCVRADMRRLFIPFLALRMFYSFRAFSRRFYASLRSFFFVVLHLYKEIYKLIIFSRGKRSGGCILFSGFAGVRNFLKAIGCVMQRMRTLWRAIRGRQPPLRL